MKKFFNIKNKCGMDLSQTEELFHDLGDFAQKRFGFKKPPTLHLVSDHENASKPLGKTAYYDPQSMSITIYTDNRHTKDILRSLAHELVHHVQNENGMLNDTGYHGSGYAQKNKNLRQSEKEAYLKGNMCFRDWEDGLKQRKPTIYNEWRIKTMSIKKWKNNELMENLSEKFGFKMDLKKLNESSCGGKRKNEEKNKGKKSMKGSDPKNYPPGADSRPKDGKISDYEATIAKKIQQSKDGSLDESIDMSFVDKVLEKTPKSMNEAEMEQMSLEFEEDAKDKAKDLAKKMMDSPEVKKAIKSGEKADLSTADKLKNALKAALAGQAFAGGVGVGSYVFGFLARFLSDEPLGTDEYDMAIDVISAAHQSGMEFGTAMYAVLSVLSLLAIYGAYKSKEKLDMDDFKSLQEQRIRKYIKNLIISEMRRK